MKRLLLLVILFILGFVNIGHTQPTLTNIEFYVNGIPGDRTGYGIVTIELLFDSTMNQIIDPTIDYGLIGENYPLNLPVGGRWENNRLWQGSFSITTNSGSA